MLDRLETTRDLVVHRSLEVLRDGQAPSGAFVAAPTYATYRFGWLRDGAFCAHALHLVGEHAPATDFHAWVGDVVLRHADLLRRATHGAATGRSDDMPPTRFTLEGELEPVGDEAWPNFQLDGYGTWLWTLGRHHGTRPLPERVHRAARLVADYLVAARDLPCFDCWEEFGTGHHTSTLGAVAAGLGAAAGILADPSLARHADELVSRLRTRHVHDGGFVKQADDDRVDASALWLSLPFGLVPTDDPLMRTTAERIRTELVRDGHGVVRYRGDTFYGGGAWILLTAWLAWFELESGDLERADARYRWILAQASPTGELPEQVLTDPQAPGRIAEWTRRWGPVASPLLWSHAMFLVLDHHRQAAMAGRS